MTIEGVLLDSVVGQKSKFLSKNGEPITVEQLSLDYYSSIDGGSWTGLHCENSMFKLLFSLLMWDVIFADIPDVFQTPFQGNISTFFFFFFF